MLLSLSLSLALSFYLSPVGRGWNWDGIEGKLSCSLFVRKWGVLLANKVNAPA